VRALAPIGRLARLCAIGLAALALASCGEGSSTTSTTSRAPGEASKPGAKPLPGHPKIGLRPTHEPARPERAQGGPYGSFTRASAAAAERRARRRKVAAMRKLERKAGKAAPFLVPVGDNSIPTYGSDASSSELAAATASLGAYLSARESGDWSTACAHMGDPVRRQVEALAQVAKGKAQDCGAAYAALSAEVPAAARTSPLSGELTAFRVQGDKAFALFYGPHNQQYMMPMVSEGGEWKVNQLEAVPWPLGS
jgi:hypothetical protein